MAITPYSGRALETLYVVKQNGKPILRGLNEAKAYAMAKQIGDGLPAHQAGTRIHSPHIEVGYDHEAMKKRDDLYREYKDYRRGGNTYGSD